MAATVKEMDGSLGFDVVVVCTSNAAQEGYWQERLEATRGQAAKKDAVIVAVHEDWGADGAGNGLGTLYAYAKARAKAMTDSGSDLDAVLRNGGTVGIYHTAGKGTRLAPLPGAENNNKPGVKLPSLVTTAPGVTAELTILEAVVRQTGCYAPKPPGACRCSGAIRSSCRPRATTTRARTTPTSSRRWAPCLMNNSGSRKVWTSTG